MSILVPPPDSPNPPNSSRAAQPHGSGTRDARGGWKRRTKADRKRLREAWAELPQTSFLDPVAQHVVAWAGGGKFDLDPAAWQSFCRDFLDGFDTPAAANLADALTMVALAAASDSWSLASTASQVDAWTNHAIRCMDFAGQDVADASASRWLLGVELPLAMATSGVINKTRATAAIRLGRELCRCEGFETCFLQSPEQLRHAVASMLRCRTLAGGVGKKLGRDVDAALDSLAGWVFALTERDGSEVLMAAADLAGGAVQGSPDRRGQRRWLGRLAKVDAEAYEPALAATTGGRGGGGKLAWEVCLPSSIWIDGDAGLAVMMPGWDRRRGRIDADFSAATMHVRIHGAKKVLIDGPLRTETIVDGRAVQPESGWEVLCDYSDDEVHYLELEQSLDGDVTLQRQLMVLRDEEAVMIGDSVLVPPRGDDTPITADGPAVISHRVELTPADDLQPVDAPETREVFLHRGDKPGCDDDSGGGQRMADRPDDGDTTADRRRLGRMAILRRTTSVHTVVDRRPTPTTATSADLAAVERGGGLEIVAG